MNRLLTPLLLAIVLAVPAHAHEAAKGSNGGRVIDAGSMHLELVTRQNTVEIFLTDSKDKAIAPAGYKGTAILMIEGKPQRIPLAPDQTRLTGQSPVSLPPDPKGVIQFTAPDGKTGQARYQ